MFSIPIKDAKKITSFFLRKLGALFVFVMLLGIDGLFMATKISYGQTITNTILLVGFVILYFRSVPRIRALMIYAVIIGFIGEYFFSIYLEMYTYRLGNLPFYVPLGHAALYARTFTFTKASFVKKHHKVLENYLLVFMAILSGIYLVFFSDVFGFVMTIAVVLLLWKRPQDRLFFYTMYFSVALLEIGGTAYGVWHWPDTAFGVFPFLPSHNPPSGISLFYFLLDVGCLVIYTQLNKSAWKRYKKMKQLKIQLND